MLGYNITLTLESIRTILKVVFDIGIIAFFIYYLLRIVRTNSRTSQIFKGIIIVILVNVVAKFFGLETVAWLTDMFISWGVLAIIIVFQPEIRSALERLGKSNVFSRMSSLSGNEKNLVVDNLVQAVGLLSQNQVGALITIEQSQSLYEYIEKGIQIQGKVTAELLTSLFVTSTPLHDGAVIIEGNTIACAGAYFPPTSLDLPNRYGARHRAAIGISEVSDAVSICVSEETGSISITENGRIYNVNRAQLKDYLMRVICGVDTQVNSFMTSVNTSSSETKKSLSNTSSNNGLLSKIAIRKQESQPRKKRKAKKVKQISSDESTISQTLGVKDELTASNEGTNEPKIKFPHHKVETIKGYETLNTRSKSSTSKATNAKASTTKKSEVKETTPSLDLHGQDSNGVAPLKSKSIEIHGSSISPMGNNVTVKEVSKVEPDSSKDVNTEVKASEVRTTQEEAKRIEDLLEKTTSLDISRLINDNSISSQMDVIRNAQLSSSDKKEDER